MQNPEILAGYFWYKLFPSSILQNTLRAPPTCYPKTTRPEPTTGLKVGRGKGKIQGEEATPQTSIITYCSFPTASSHLCVDLDMEEQSFPAVTSETASNQVTA